MINSVSSGVTAMSMTSNTQRSQQGKDMFQLSDTDGDGAVSATELETLVAGIEEETGTSISVEDALSYDSDGDSALSGEELLNMLSSNGVAPEEGQGPPPPPPPSSAEASAAYEENSGDDLLSTLLDSMNEEDDENSSYFSSLSITT